MCSVAALCRPAPEARVSCRGGDCFLLAEAAWKVATTSVPLVALKATDATSRREWSSRMFTAGRPGVLAFGGPLSSFCHRDSPLGALRASQVRGSDEAVEAGPGSGSG